MESGGHILPSSRHHSRWCTVQKVESLHFHKCIRKTESRLCDFSTATDKRPLAMRPLAPYTVRGRYLLIAQNNHERLSHIQNFLQTLRVFCAHRMCVPPRVQAHRMGGVGTRVYQCFSMRKKKSSIEEISRKGGKATLKKYGSAHFKRLAEKSWETRRAQKKK